MSRAPSGAGRRGPVPARKTGRPGSAAPRPLTGLPIWFTKRSTGRGVALAAGLFLAGLFVGSLADFAYATRVQGVPVGVAVALLAEGGVIATAGIWNAARSAALLPALGWVVSVLVFATERPEEDVIIAPTHVGYAYLLGGLILFVVLIVLPYERMAGEPTG